jgi:hypothetical protein
MLLTELDVANKIYAFRDLTDTAKKRRVRGIIRKIGISPYVIDRTWCIPELYLRLIEEEICPLKSQKEKVRTIGMSEARSRGKRSLSQREQLIKLLQTDIDYNGKMN